MHVGVQYGTCYQNLLPRRHLHSVSGSSRPDDPNRLVLRFEGGFNHFRRSESLYKTSPPVAGSSLVTTSLIQHGAVRFVEIAEIVHPLATCNSVPCPSAKSHWAVQLFETPFTTAVLIHFPQTILTPRTCQFANLPRR